MAVPRYVRVFTLFVNGTNELGRVTEVTLPKLTRKTESYRGGGMLGAVNIDLGLDDGALDMSFVAGGVVRDLLLEYAGEIDETAFRFVAELYTDGEESQLLEVETRGRVTEIDKGTTKQGDATSHTFQVKNTYYRMLIDDEDIIEIDLLNFVYKKDGENMFTDRISSALGLG